MTPAPITTASAASAMPPRVTTCATRPSPSKRSSSSPAWIVTPCSSSIRPEEAPGRRAEAAFERVLLLHDDRAALAEHA